MELKIKWDGTAPGLAENRLSLSAFGESLPLLLASLRRIATNLVGDVFEERQARGGRFANAARQLDIEIAELVKGSAGFDSVITFSTPLGSTFPLLDFAQSAGTQLLDALDSEGRGVAKNASVRRYLQALPKGITRQTYSLHLNGTVLQEVSFGEAVLPELPMEAPYLVQYSGNVIGVGFAPGRPEVRIKTETGSITFAATAEQVDAALRLRESEVTALGVFQDNAHRLLILRDTKTAATPSTRESAIYDRWQTVLKRLAQ
ncbi:MAG: hypothetical protein Q7S58_00120 [Candidatus Binatus sp.]|uniref:hypothetical protein n=1 Tax=Candidatus Binatus sp. TaxID=2811406 RepID=UPI002727E416|nr:hypothetical protein [Candidatus Binatus sp.]MDO8430790.1 hypothetical protein [Candidatus Binatus sp.]